MRLVIILIILVAWAAILQNFAAPAEIAITEYAFWDGMIHGVSWFLLLIMKWLGNSIVVFADFHTYGYIVGFVIGVFLSFILLILCFSILAFSD